MILCDFNLIKKVNRLVDLMVIVCWPLFW